MEKLKNILLIGVFGWQIFDRIMDAREKKGQKQSEIVSRVRKVVKENVQLSPDLQHTAFRHFQVLVNKLGQRIPTFEQFTSYLSSVGLDVSSMHLLRSMYIDFVNQMDSRYAN